MRLINVRTHELQEFDKPPIEYSILSHRWIDDQEVRLHDWEAYVAEQALVSSHTKEKSGFIKIRNACTQAKERGLEWLWADTACIDKRDNSEVGKSINLMFSWYQSASVCFVYLHDVQSGNRLEELTEDKPTWFTRGWTLQELLAPKKVLFFDQAWSFLGDRKVLAEVINKFTGIPVDVLCGRDIRSYSYADRLSWAKGRQTKEPEDRVYSLLGLLGVALPAVGYGIGLEAAFWQLESAIERQKANGNLSLTADELLTRFMANVENITPAGMFELSGLIIGGD
jgi:heterokaryon incompatibility protein (HET)